MIKTHIAKSSNAYQAELLKAELPSKAFNLLDEYLLSKVDHAIAFDTSSPFNVKNNIFSVRTDALINIKKMNEYGYINKLLEEFNNVLSVNGLLFLVAETGLQRRARILRKYTHGFNYMVYFLDYCFHRILPKLSLTRRIYYFVKGNRARVLHEVEILGRIYSCGFELVKKRKCKGLSYFVVRKTRLPSFDTQPTYGLLVRLRRVGLNGDFITVRKLRSMHSYSEYMQEFIFDNNGTVDGDKIIRDYRVTTWGRVLRKFWLDELPMLINLFNGDMKIVGVRPLSKHKFETYPKYLQELRIKSKPGLIPPYYADLPDNLESFYSSEEDYILSYLKSPLTTDVKYFWKAFVNIIFKGARSK